MKKTLVVLFCVCWAAAPAAAQAPPPPGGAPMAPAEAARPQFGITGGVNFASVRFDPDIGGVDVSNKIGVAVGGVVVYPLGPNISMIANGVYTQKGAKLSDGTDSLTISYAYLEVPVVLAYNIPTTGNMTPFLFGGGAVAAKLSAEASAGGQSQDLTGVNSIDFGLVLGAGVKMQTAGGSTGMVDARYTLGLNDIAEDSSEGSAKHGVFSLMAGYLF